MPIEVILTERIRDAIEEVFSLDFGADVLKNELQRWRRSEANFNVEHASNEHSTHVKEVIDGNDPNIPFSTVKKVFETLNKAGKVIYLNELMEGSAVYFEPVKEPKKSPELVARLEKLQAKQDQLRYRTMVKNVDKELLYKDKRERAFEVRSTSRQLSSVINFIFSVAGTFAFGYVCSQYAFTYVGLRVMFGILLASLVALAELYFMAKSSEF